MGQPHGCSPSKRDTGECSSPTKPSGEQQLTIWNIWWFSAIRAELTNPASAVLWITKWPLLVHILTFHGVATCPITVSQRNRINISFGIITNCLNYMEWFWLIVSIIAYLTSSPLPQNSRSLCWLLSRSPTTLEMKWNAWKNAASFEGRCVVVLWKCNSYFEKTDRLRCALYLYWFDIL